jgi:hypothetical protein
LEPADDGSEHHYQQDALQVIYQHPWDLLIAHPPCTYLCNSGVRWLHTRPERWAELDKACAFFLALWNAPCDRVAIENPVMHKHARERIGLGRPTFTLQPYEHGEPETKRTCFWTRGLPAIAPSNIVPCTSARVHRMAPGPNRQQERSRTLEGVAKALAMQWGTPILQGIAPIPICCQQSRRNG